MDKETEPSGKDIVRRKLERSGYEVRPSVCQNIDFEVHNSDGEIFLAVVREQTTTRIGQGGAPTTDVIVKDDNDRTFFTAFRTQGRSKSSTLCFVFDTKYIRDIKEIFGSNHRDKKIFVADSYGETIYWETLKNLQNAKRVNDILFPLTIGDKVYYAVEQFTGRCFFKTSQDGNCTTEHNDALKKHAVKIAMKTLTKSVAYTSPSFTANIFDFYTDTNLYVVKPQVAEFIGEDKVPIYHMDESEFEFLKGFQARTDMTITIVFVDVSFGEFAYADLEFLKSRNRTNGYNFPMFTKSPSDELRIQWHKNYFRVSNIPRYDFEDLKKFYLGEC